MTKFNANGRVTSTGQVWGHEQIVRTPANPEERLATRRTRKEGACASCKEKHQRVSYAMIGITDNVLR
jgi:hypothetical protein